MTLLDANARQQALNVENILLKAGAGSGKTGVLTSRFLKLLGMVEHPSQIVALTFTNKAAQEMKSRILDALINARQNPEPTADYEKQQYDLAKKALANSDARGWNLDKSPNALQLCTIDSFSKKILSRHTASDIEKVAISDISDDPKQIYRNAAKETLALFDNEQYQESLTNLLKHFGNKFSKVEHLLCEMLEKRDRWAHLVMEGKSNAREELEANRKKFLSLMLADPMENLNQYESQLQATINQLELTDNALLEFVDGGFKPDFADNLTVLPKLAGLLLTAKLEPKKRFTKKEGIPAKLGKDEKAELVDELKGLSLTLQESLAMFANVPDYKFSENEWSLLASAFEVMPLLLANLNLAFKAAGKVDYTEVALNALSALDNTGATDNAIYHATNIKHMMVDETQDTSDFQTLMLQLIVNTWSEDEGRSLFVVGDSCQSIYGFRGANLNQFLKIERGIGSQSMKVLELEVNFRSSMGIVEWVNNTFKQVFPNKNDLILGAGAFTESAAVNYDDETNPVEIHGFVNDTSATEEAEFIANEIAHIQLKDPSASIAVLGRTRGNLTAIIDELNKRDEITTHDVDLHRMDKQPLVIDALALIRTVVDNTDQEALVSVLNSGLVGIPLERINKLIKADKDLFTAINRSVAKETLDTHEFERLQYFIDQYELAKDVIFESELDVLVNGLWIALHGNSMATDKQAVKNVKDVFRLLKGKSIEDVTLEWLDERMENLYSNSEIDVDAANAPVQLMTVHKSKGLEFSYVFCVGMSKTGRPNSKGLLNWSTIELENTEVSVLASSEELGIDTNGKGYADFLNKLQANREREELSRLFYVAVTRAIKKCYLTGAIKEKGDKVIAPAKGSLFGIISDMVIKDAQLHYSLEEEQDEVQAIEPVRNVVLHPAERHFPERNTLAKYQGLSHKVNSKELIDWQVPADRNEGIVIHALIEQINKDGIDSWDIEKLQSYKKVILSLLRQQGVEPQKMLSSYKRVINEVSKLIQEPVFRFLSGDHQEQNDTELRVALKKNRKIHVLQIDKAFVENGVGHVIDWKSAKAEQYQSLDAMKAIQASIHKDKLNLYKQAYSSITGKESDTALYFTNAQELLCS